MTTPATRRQPNILITGTPGTGKSSTASTLADELSFQHIDVSKFIVEKSFHEGWDEKFQCWILGEESEDQCMSTTTH
jgi:adenylate kinase